MERPTRELVVSLFDDRELAEMLIKRIVTTKIKCTGRNASGDAIRFAAFDAALAIRALGERLARELDDAPQSKT